MENKITLLFSIFLFSLFNFIYARCFTESFQSEVTVGGEIVGEINRGILVLLGVARGDAEKEASYLLDKTLNLRVFENADEKMNLSLLDIEGDLLVVSQFTLCGDARRGRRPSFIEAAVPDEANRLYEFSSAKPAVKSEKSKPDVFRR
jgi:D-tyrosyl-tRNA(Tyr) deacylase